MGGCQVRGGANSEQTFEQGTKGAGNPFNTKQINFAMG